MRNTCAGVAPSVAAASPGLGSSDSQVVPTARITTATLKKVRPAMIATGVPSRPRKPSGPDSPTSSRNATPTTTVGSTNGTSSSARMRLRNGKASRCRTYAAGRPSRTEQTRGQPCGPDREPQHPVGARPAEDVDDGAGVEMAVDHEAAADHPADRQHEEDGEHQHRPQGEAGESEQPPSHWLVTSLQSRSHSSRWAAISAGSTE